MNTRRFVMAAIVLAMAAALAVSASGQVKVGATAADVALYAGADRLQKLVAGAKKESALTIYTSAQTNDLGAVVSAFEKKDGIDVSIWRAGSENVLNRVLQESRANRHTVDIVETNGPELESMHREQILQLVRSPHHADLIAPAIRPHGEWVGTRLNVFVQAYNTRLVKKEELPKTWEDLLDPRWKGRLGIEQEDSDWLAGVFSEIGEARGTKIFRQIVATNRVSARKGHTLLTQLVASGEVPLALTVYNYKAQQLKTQGAPIDWFTIGNAIARPNGVGVARRAPNPHAAVLFYDFELSEEGQKIIATRDFVPTSKKVDTPLNKVPMTFVDARVTIDEYDKWKNLYEELFLARGAEALTLPRPFLAAIAFVVGLLLLAPGLRAQGPGLSKEPGLHPTAHRTHGGDPGLRPWTALRPEPWALGPASVSAAQASLATYEGPDRPGRIAAAARKEGTLTLYTTIAEKDLPVLVKPFEAKYGVKVVVWRAGTDKVLQRTVAEAAAGRYDVDVVHFGAPEMEALSREKVLLAIKSPVHQELQPGSVPPHREWAATLLSVWVQVYNTRLVNKETLPKAYKDLLDPRWKGKLGIEAKDQDWFASVVDVMGGGEAGLKFFRDMVAVNGVSVRQGHTLLNNMVISGEVPLALTVYNYMPEQAKKKGAPVDWFALEPAIARANAVGVARRAPHPNAALLFYEYLLGEGQQYFVGMDYVPTNTRVSSPLKGVKILQTDPIRSLDEVEKWTRLFEDTIIRRARR